MPGSSSTRQIGPAASVAIALTIALTAAIVGIVRHLENGAIACTAVAVVYLLCGDLLPASRGVTERISRVLPPQIAWLLAAPILACWFVYAVGTGSLTPTSAAIACAYVLVPLALLSLHAGSAAPGLPEYLAWISIALPLKTHWLQNLWPWPHGAGYSFGILFLINVAVAGFLFVKRLDGVGYNMGWGSGWLLTIVGSFAIIAAIVIPLGLYLKFLAWGPLKHGVKELPLAAIGILLFTAWPEELLFRGILQNMLQRTLKSDLAGWIAASVVFGFSHIANGGFPNWRYVLLASIAGFFYGYAWRKTNSIFASAIVHASVDFFWRVLFR